MSFENDRQSVTGYQLQGDERNEDFSHVWGGAVTRRQSPESPAFHPFQSYLKNTSADSYYSSISGGAGGGSARTVVGHTPAQATAGSPRPQESSISKWTDFIDTAIPEESLYSMPLWANTDNFDSFATGQLTSTSAAGDAVTTLFLEGYMDKVRWLAEECDNLSTIQMFADGCDGFAGLSAAVARELHEEYRCVHVCACVCMCVQVCACVSLPGYVTACASH